MDNKIEIELITSFYLSDNLDRMNELLKSLVKNLQSPYINKIHLFLDSVDCLEYLKKNLEKEFFYKIKTIEFDNQPLYSDLFKYSLSLENRICMIANSDIWLHSIKNIAFINRLLQEKTMDRHVKIVRNGRILALTRHEHDLSCPLIDNFSGSHDAFIFNSPIDKDLIDNIKHKQNLLGAENRLLYFLKKLGYKFSNPCKNIVTVHEHGSYFRKWYDNQKKGKKAHISSRVNRFGFSYAVNPHLDK